MSLVGSGPDSPPVELLGWAQSPLPMGYSTEADHGRGFVGKKGGAAKLVWEMIYPATSAWRVIMCTSV